MPRKKKEVRRDLFGDTIEEPRPSSGEIIPLDFETHAVRMLMIRGLPWWVASDVCRALEILNPSDTLKKRIDEDEKGVARIYTPSGEQEMLVVNESGIYSLIFASTKAEAKRFKRWVTHEVLPEIRRTGTYTLGRSKLRKVQRKLNCDAETAQARIEQTDINKVHHACLSDESAPVKFYVEWHNAAYRGAFEGREAPALRGVLGIGPRQTPLDRMDAVPLSTNTHAKIIANRVIRELAKAGRPVPLDEQAAILERITRDLAAHDLQRFGIGARYDVVDDPRRGKILDVVQGACSLN